MPRPLLIFSQSDYKIWIIAINSHTLWQTKQSQISWLLQKPTDLDLHCLQRQGISWFSRTRVKRLDHGQKVARHSTHKNSLDRSCNFAFTLKTGTHQSLTIFEICDNKNLKGYLWKQWTHKRKKIGYSDLSLFINRGVLCEAGYATHAPPPASA